MLGLRPGALGDTLLAVPALRALRRCRGEVTLAAHAGAARLLQELGEVQRGLAFDDPWIAAVLRGGPADDPVVAWTSAPVPGAVVHAPARPPDRVHCAEYLLRTLAPLRCDLTLDASPLGVRPLSCDEILVHPGSGSASKNWPAERFAAVIRALDQPVRLVVGEADACAAADVERALGQRSRRLTCNLSDLAARLAGCAAYLGNDSGVSHLAGLCGTRTVVMFGPSDPGLWRPVGPRVTTFEFQTPIAEVARALVDQCVAVGLACGFG